MRVPGIYENGLGERDVNNNYKYILYDHMRGSAQYEGGR